MIERLGRRKEEARAGLLLARAKELTPSTLPGAAVDQLEAAEGAVRLGAIAAGLARAGADKLTLFLGPQIEAAGPRIAELLGERTRGRVVPIVGELLGRKDRYADDRLFVSIALTSETPEAASLAHAGHPLLLRTLADASEIDAELRRWAWAARVMGALLEVDEGASAAPPSAAPDEEPALRAPGLSLFAARGHAQVLRKAAGTLGAQVAASAAGWIAAHLALADTGEFVALLGELALLPQARGVQAAIRDATRLACTAGLHLRSAGRLEEAVGGNFLLLGGADSIRADFAVLLSRGRRALRIECDGGPGTILEALLAAVKMISR